MMACAAVTVDCGLLNKAKTFLWNHQARNDGL